VQQPRKALQDQQQHEHAAQYLYSPEQQPLHTEKVNKPSPCITLLYPLFRPQAPGCYNCLLLSNLQLYT
jgi:hypothetical protein